MTTEYPATVTSKGQVTIPAAIRRCLGIEAGTTIVFDVAEDGSVRVRLPKYPTIASLAGAAGKLPRALSWQEVSEIAAEDRADAVMAKLARSR